MMLTGHLLITGFLMGLVGAPHCVAMCAAGCTAVTKTCAAGPTVVSPTVVRPLLMVLLGRMLSYALAGAMAATGLSFVRELADSVAWIRPFWTLFQLAVLLLGLSLVVLGRQPQCLDAWALQVGQVLRRLVGTHGAQSTRHVRLLVLGGLWVALPCGLLYSALAVAALASSALEGAMVMVAFSVGGALALWGSAHAWWLLYRPRVGQGGVMMRGHSGALAVRLAGGMLFVASAWALGHGIWQPLLAWCGLGD